MPDTLKRIKELLDIQALSTASDILITDYLAGNFLLLADKLHQH